MADIRWPRLIRLLVLGVVAALAVFLLGKSWAYVYTLTHPGCPAAPAPPPNRPAPQAVSLPTQDGVTLGAWFYPSHNGAVVVVMGSPVGNANGYSPNFEPLLQAGYGILQIGSRACATPASAVTLGYLEAGDAAAGLQYILQYHSSDVKHIGIMGFSMGAAAAIRSAARNPLFEAVLAEGGYYNLGDDFVDADSDQPRSIFQQTVFYSVAAIFWLQTGINPWDSSPVDDIALISPRPVFLLYGEHEVAAGRALTQFEAAAEPKDLWIVPGGDHGSNHLASPDQYAARIVAFFDRALLGKE
ncbi:MAG: prolyl oligopeptidase family serine peptidase [Anaerolineae bacterium]|nr:prolyl oligopeptidase family serine peptidase [Anaerolineae bacterium]